MSTAGAPRATPRTVRSVRSLSDRGPAGSRALLFLVAALVASFAFAGPVPSQTWREVPLPPGFQVIVNELEGPVFADAEGRTLYEWPQHVMRNGYSGEAPGIPACYGEPTTA